MPTQKNTSSSNRPLSCLPSSACKTIAERDEVKKVARELLNKLQALLVLNWKEKASSRSQLKLAIEDTLDNGLPRAYSKELDQQKCTALFDHVYEHHTDEGQSTYADIAQCFCHTLLSKSCNPFL